MKDFKKMIEGKSVAIVGPAKYMQGAGLGKEIDEHDVVVRINRGIELVQKFSKDIGSRTDILYSCLIEKAAHAGFLDVNSLKNEHKVDFICVPPQSDYSGVSQSTTFHYMIKKETIEKITNNFPTRLIDHNFNNYLAKKVMCKPNTGFLSIYDVLRFNPKKFSIYGFSFYLDGFMDGCKSGIDEEKNVNEQEFANMAYNSKRHVQKNMWNYCKKTLLNSDKIVLDKTLEKILKMESFSKENFTG